MEDKVNINQPSPADFFAKVDSQSPEAEPVPEPMPEPKVTPPLVDFSSVGSPSVPIPEQPPFPQPNRRKTLVIFAGILLLLGAVFVLAGGILPKLRGRKSEVSLVYWGLWEPESVMAEVITEYQKSHPKVKINYIMQSPKDYRERLESAILRGEGPDIFRFHNTWGPMLEDILAPVPASVMDAATFERIFYPVVRSDLRVGNNYLGIPLEIDNLALFINEEIFSTAGKTPPTNWDEFRKVALELTVKDAAGKIQSAGAALGVTSNVDHWSDVLGLMLFQNSADPANPTNNLAEDALRFYTQFYQNDRIWDEALPSSTYYFASGRLAMYFGPSWRVFEIKALNPNLKFRVMPVPQLPGVNLAWATYWVEGVNKKSNNAQIAWEFLKFLSSSQTLQKLFQSQSKLRLFGEPYSRTDMADLLKKEPYIGVFIEQAPKAKSWYLCSRTFDNGINDKIIKYYEDAVNAVSKGQSPKSALATVAQGVAQVLSQYGIK